VREKDLKYAYEKHCLGHAECHINLAQYAYPLSHKYETASHGAKAECLEESSRMYMQYSCDLEDVLISNQHIGLGASIAGIICCLMFSFLVYFLRKAAVLNYKLWDISTVTTADFTVQVTFSDKMWPKWKEHIAANKNPKCSFKEYFREELLRQLNTVECALKGHDHDPIDIATIFFAYPNNELINLLNKRGDTIFKNSANSMKKCANIEEKIEKLI